MKAIISSIIIALAVIIGSIIIVNSKINSNSVNNNQSVKDNTSIVDGKQIIEIKAKGGYEPRRSLAKAGVPTIIRFNTNGTFDCSSSVIIPSMGIRKYLPQSGNTDIDIGISPRGRIVGSCGMGMYPFQVDFED